MRRVIHTYPDGRELREPILCPWENGAKIVIPKGTWIVRMGRKDSGRSKRQMLITLDHSSKGYFTTYNGEKRLLTFEPELVWAGSGGYWARAYVTEEMLQANGVTEDRLAVNEREIYTHRYDIYRLTGVRP